MNYSPMMMSFIRAFVQLFKAAEKGLEPLFIASSEYFSQFSRAQLVFRHQRVFDIKTKVIPPPFELISVS
jgi:hypothetical protein